MLNLIISFIKMCLIGGIAIVLGSFVTIGDKTVNEYVAELASRSKNATITRDVQRWAHQIKQPLKPVAVDRESNDEDFDNRDRDELKTLIKKKALKKK